MAIRLLWLAAAILLGEGTVGAQVTVPGRLLLVEDPAPGSAPALRRIVVVGRGPTLTSGVGGSPVTSGALLAIVANGATPSIQSFTLEPGLKGDGSDAGWTQIAGLGFRYRDRRNTRGPVRLVVVKRNASTGSTLVKAVLKGAGITVLPPDPGTDGGLVLTLDGAGPETYCVSFGGAAGGRVTNAGATQFRVTRATADAGCPSPPTTSTTSTSTSTSTSSTAIFARSVVTSSVMAPTDLEFLPDDTLFVTERGGVVWTVRPAGGLASAPFVDVSDEVFSTGGGGGLLGIALDPNFATTGRVYLTYTASFAGGACGLGRVVSYTATTDAEGNLVADPASRTVLIGSTPADALVFPVTFHSAGGLAFARDGTLLVQASDGSHPNPDATHLDGLDPGGRDPLCFGPGGYDPSADIGAFRAQDIDVLAGKLLRIDPTTGAGLASNPFYNGDPSAARSKVFAYGLRSDFRMTVRPGTGSTDPADGQPGSVYIGDVGFESWEELDVARGGENFGWPCWEGPNPQDLYPGLVPAHHGCDTLPLVPGSSGGPENPGVLTLPRLSYSLFGVGPIHPPAVAPFYGRTVIAGVFVPSASGYPATLGGRFLFGDFWGLDYSTGWIRVAEFDGDDELVTSSAVPEVFARAGCPTAFAVRPSNGAIVYTSFRDGAVYELAYAGP